MTTENSDALKAQDKETIYELSDQLSGIYLAAKTIAERHDFPDGEIRDLATYIDELSGILARIATHIVNPDADHIIDGVRERIRCGID